MDLSLFATQLNEGMMGELYSRVKELRALRNSGEDIVKKISDEFKKNTKDIEKLFLPHALKDLSDNEDINDRRFEELKHNYRHLFTKHELSVVGKTTFVRRLIDRVIAKGTWSE